MFLIWVENIGDIKEEYDSWEAQGDRGDEMVLYLGESVYGAFDIEGQD